MLIEYCATDKEDQTITNALKKYTIKEWFNPEDLYYILETEDTEVITVMALLGIELHITDAKEIE